MMDSTQILQRIQYLEDKINHLERLEKTLTAQSSGFIGGAWQKDPIRLGYSGPIAESLSNTALTAGTVSLDGAVVPAGEIWVITQLRVRYVGTITNVSLLPVARVNGIESDIDEINPVVSGMRYGIQGYWVIPPGDRMRLYILNATLNDDAYFSYSGWRIDTDL